jgi:transposase-like protein
MVDRMLAGEPGLYLVAQTQVPEQALHRWKRQAQIDAGLTDGGNRVEGVGLRTAPKRIKALEKELRLVKDASEIYDSLVVMPPKKRQAVAEGLVTRGHSGRSATRITGVPRSTFVWRTTPRTPGNRTIRRVLLADSIGQIH